MPRHQALFYWPGIFRQRFLPAVKVVILDMLFVPVEAVCSVQLLAGRRVIVKFGSSEVYHNVVGCYDGCSFVLPDGGGSVIISDRCGTTSYVAVHEAPFEFPCDLPHRYFARFGRVLHVQMNDFSSGKLKGVSSGTCTLTMHLRTPFSSSVMLMGHSLYVFHEDQPRTCFRCDYLAPLPGEGFSLVVGLGPVAKCWCHVC